MDGSTTAAVVAIVAAVAAAASAVFALVQARVADAARAAEFDAAFSITWEWNYEPDLNAFGDYALTGESRAVFQNIGREDAFSLHIYGRFWRRWLGPWPRLHPPTAWPMPGAPKVGQLFRFRWKDAQGHRRRQNVTVPTNPDPREPDGMAIPQIEPIGWR